MTFHNYRFSPWRVKGDQRIVASEATWKQPVKWGRAAKAAGERRRVLVGVDVFEDWTSNRGHAKPIVSARGVELFRATDGGWIERPTMTFDSRWEPATLDDVRRRLFGMIDATPNLDWLLVTKRPENIAKMMPEYDGHYVSCEHDGIVPVRPNVWLGTSVESQEQTRRIEELRRVPAAVRFLSCDPMVGPVLMPYCPTGPMLDWIIVGGESGRGARPMHPQWVRTLRDQCEAAGVPFFFKGWGEWLPYCQWRKDLPLSPLEAGPQTLVPATAKNGTTQGVVSAYKIGKKASGRLLDGREWNEIPKVGGGS